MKRQRVKFLCKAKDCGSEFNSDYRLEHNRKQHGGRLSVPYEIVGAVKNPFEAARRKKVRLDQFDEEDAGSHDCQSASADPVVEATLLNHPMELEHEPGEDVALHVSALSSRKDAEPNRALDEYPRLRRLVLEDAVNITSETESVISNSESEMESTQSSNCRESSDEDDAPDAWITCAGKLQHIMNTIDKTGDSILKEVKQPSVPNIEQFVLSVTELAENVGNQCNALKKSAKRCLENIKKQKGLVSEQEVACLMEHDPGKRGEILSDNQREFLINMGPCQPKLAAYASNPSIKSGKQNKFSSSWFEDYPHLEYSVQKDAAYCFVCCLFPKGAGRPTADKAWTVTGVSQWQKMKSVGTKKKGKLTQHFTSQSHREALRDFARFMNPNQKVDMLLDANRRLELIKEAEDATLNTRIVTILCDVVRTLAMQDIAFRGETDETSNFYQVVQLLSRHCSLLEYWQNETRMRPYHVTYMSRCTQNEFIKLIGDAVRYRMIKELEEAPAFSVMADTTPDTSNNDQISIVVRYVTDDKPVERLLSLTVLRDKSGDGHATEILRSLNEHNVDVRKLYFQSYDFAACMSGVYNGCQKKLNDKIKKDFPQQEIPYIPCQAHRLNTFVERSCKASALVSSMFVILQSLYTFFSSSTKRSEALQMEQNSIEGALKLRNLSQTRWIARSESIDSVWISFESIIALLQKIIDKELNSDANTQDQARALLKKMKRYDFIFSLGIMRFIMRHCKVLVVQLQEEGLNLLDALSLVSTTTNAIKKIRNEVQVDNQVKAATAMARQVGSDPEEEFHRHHRRRVNPRRFDEHGENEAEIAFASFYRKETFSVLDQIIADCEDNWKKVFLNIKPFSVLLPPWNDISEKLAEDLCKLLGGRITSGSLLGELSVLREESVDRMPLKTKSVREVAAFLSQKKQVYPACHMAFTFLQTAPVTVASNERSFSKLKLVKTKLRSTMLQDRLESLMLISCERDFAERIDMQELIRNWVNLKKRRVRF